MAEESEASFSASVSNKIRETYQYRCVICLTWLSTTQCVHLLDSGTEGELQAEVREAVRLGILHEGFDKDAEMNGLVMCPNCHSLFTTNVIALSLPTPILKYLEKYVSSTPKSVLKPLYKVLDLLVDELYGKSTGLPKPTAILPYIGLFTLVTLDRTATATSFMMTGYLPGLSIIRNNKFKAAPANTSPTAKNVARIFDSLDIEKDTPFNIGSVPLRPGVASFEEKRYWRIPVFAGTIFAALMLRLPVCSSKCKDIALARKIFGHLMVKYADVSGPSDSAPSSDGGSSDGRGPNGGRGGRGGGRGGGGGPREGGKTQGKRKNAGTEKGKKKARRVAGGDGADSGECSVASVEAPRPFPVLEWNASVVAGVPSDGRSEIPSSLDTNKDNSDIETGRSISATSEDNPDEWRFGPSFTSNKIIFTDRAVNLT